MVQLLRLQFSFSCSANLTTRTKKKSGSLRKRFSPNDSFTLVTALRDVSHLVVAADEQRRTVAVITCDLCLPGCLHYEVRNSARLPPAPAKPLLCCNATTSEMSGILWPNTICYSVTWPNLGMGRGVTPDRRTAPSSSGAPICPRGGVLCPGSWPPTSEARGKFS